MLNREEQLASLFAIEVEFRSEMRNRLHVMLRSCPEIARRLSDHEVARRWLTITKLAECKSDAMPVPAPKKMEELVKDTKRIKKLRGRLTDISWFMGILAVNIARRANAEDDCRGRFSQKNVCLKCGYNTVTLRRLVRSCVASTTFGDAEKRLRTHRKAASSAACHRS